MFCDEFRIKTYTVFLILYKLIINMQIEIFKVKIFKVKILILKLLIAKTREIIFKAKYKGIQGVQDEKI